MNKPNPIFKYAKINNYTLDAIYGSYLWFSLPGHLNDPFDLDYQFSDNHVNTFHTEATTSFFNDYIAQLEKAGKGEYTRLAKETAEKIINDQEFKDSLREGLKVGHTYSVCCFAESYDSILMWSHYAENHSGVCLIYDLETSSDIWHALSPVEYSREFPIVETMDEIPKKALLRKSIEWSYEQEWRALKRLHNGQILISRTALKGAIFGCATPEAKIKEVVKACNESRYDKQIDLEFFRMVRGKREYKLVREELVI